MDKSSEVPFCVNCVHFVEADLSMSHRCSKSFSVNVVTGLKSNSFAQINREYKTFCGPEGREFEPKLPEPVKKTLRERFWNYLYDNSSYTKLL